MLFHSPSFIFIFLPISLLGYYLLGSVRKTFSILWLALVSLFFYGYWNANYVPLILASILVNYSCGVQIISVTARGAVNAGKFIRNFAIFFNLALLVYFKYLMFGLAQVDILFNAGFSVPNITLPIGISFYTFTQIAYLVDCSRGVAHENKFLNYLLFVSYFPHLVAGPILHHAEMMPQFKGANARINWDNLARGITFFSFGIFKKVVVADSLTRFVDPVFAIHGGVPAPADAWIAAISYTLQLYYDFSGYSDMAIGLSLMFNIQLPVNFDSPYKSKSIIEFWRRWHMTLSRFLRDYLYFGLGGNRKGVVRRYINLIITMLLGGLWHGANWTFVIWGALHGFYLVVNHLWRALPVAKKLPVPTAVKVALTFISVVVAWVFFRASDIQNALQILHAMAGLPRALNPVIFDWHDAVFIVAPLVWAWLAPNTNEIMNYKFGKSVENNVPRNFMRWNPHAGWAVVTGATLFGTAIVGVAAHRSLAFLYFQF